MTRSIYQDAQNDLGVLLETNLYYGEIANCLTLSKATVHQYCKIWNIQKPENTDGRSQILTEASMSLIKRMSTLGRLKSVIEIFDYFKAVYPSLTYNTTLNALKGLGFKARPKKKSLPGSPLQPHYVIPTLKRGGGSVMVWACVTSYRAGHICKIYDGRMTALDYIHILKIELADTLDYYHLGHGDFIFQHDNDPKHSVKIATSYLKEEAK